MYSWRKSFSSHAPTLFIFMFSSTDDQIDDGDDDSIYPLGILAIQVDDKLSVPKQE